MQFDEAVHDLNNLLDRKQPSSFSSGWILRQSPSIYRFVQSNVRTKLDYIDWDAVTMEVKPPFQRRWIHGWHQRNYRNYEGRSEVEVLFSAYGNQLYTFITPTNKADKDVADKISIVLVRLAQRRNLTAKREVMSLTSFVIDDWIEKSTYLKVWNGYDTLIQEQLEACIRRYRYSGSFLGYVYRTLEYAGRGLKPLMSLDTPFSNTENRMRIDSVVQMADTQEIRLFSK